MDEYIARTKITQEKIDEILISIFEDSKFLTNLREKYDNEFDEIDKIYDYLFISDEELESLNLNGEYYQIIKNVKYIFPLYAGKYDMTDEQLINYINILFFFDSKKLNEIFVIMYIIMSHSSIYLYFDTLIGIQYPF